MARRHYWQFLVTDEGNPIENAQISIYIAGTTDAVWVYTDEVGTVGSQTAPQVTTSRKGYFEFWVADQNETNGYPLSTKFKIAWSAAGVSSGYIDYIDVFSTSWEPVDETDTNILKNKAVSNHLAKGWEDHRLAALPGDTPHGMDFVDESDAISVIAGVRNKVISNYQGFLWDMHAKRQYDGSLSLTVAPNEAPTAHGIVSGTPQPVSYSGYYGGQGDTVMNRLTSDDLIYQSDSHIRDQGADHHSQYALVSGGESLGYRSFYGPIGYTIASGLDSLSDITSYDFVTKGMLDGVRHTQTILSSDWMVESTILTVGSGYTDSTVATSGGSGTGMTVTITTSGGALASVVIAANGIGYKTGDIITVGGGSLGTFRLGNVYYLVNHNLNTDYPVVMLWNTTETPDEVITPESIVRNSINDTTITIQTVADCYVRMLI